MSVYLMVTAILSVWLWTYPKWYCLLIVFFWCIQIWRLPIKKSLHVGVFCIVTMMCSLHPRQSQIDTTQKQWKVDVSAQNITVKGNVLTFQTTMSNERVTGIYRLPTAYQADEYRKNNYDLTLYVVGDFKRIESASGQYEFDYQRYAYEQHKQFYYFNINEMHVIHKKLNLVAYLRQKILERLPDNLSQWIDVFIFGKSWDYDYQFSLQGLGLLWLFSLSGVHVSGLLELIKKLFYRLGVTKKTTHYIECTIALGCLLLSPHKLALQRVVLYKLFGKNFLWIMLIYILLQPYIIYQLAFQLSFGIAFIKAFEHSRKLIPIWVAVVLSAHYYQFYVLSYLLAPILLILFKKIIFPGLWIIALSGVLAIPLPFISLVDTTLSIMLNWINTLALQNIFTLVTGRYHDLIYVAIIVSAIYGCYYWKKLRRTYRLLFAISLGIMLFPKPVTRMVMFDVGQGDSFLIQKGYDVVLIDTGGQFDFKKEAWELYDTPSQFERKVLPMIRGMGIQHLKAVILSHADYDHCGDLPAVQKTLRIEQIIYGQGAPIKGTLAVQGGTRLTIGSIDLHVLYPNRIGQGKNEDSLIIYTKIGTLSFLFMGDATSNNELELIHHYPQLQVDVLKVSHHGSKTSTDLTFLKQIKPRYALISCGKNNRYQHPHQEVLDRLKDVVVYRSDKDGVVSVTQAFGQMKWERFIK